ncbi:hypothetical protein SNE40_013091 [Patella caerulea]|uniref:THAP-type domain-containing protein n=1 Tax=Patella caerulea TaxID=87958 RepID=A0AAN8PN91_PATCE
MANWCVINCSNSYYKLQRWMQSFCEVHNSTKEHCSCQKPFDLLPFPNEKQADTRKTWIRNVNRNDSQNVWIPKSHSRICTVHFADGKPTLKNPYPTLVVGHNDLKTARKPSQNRKKHRYFKNSGPGHHSS